MLAGTAMAQSAAHVQADREIAPGELEDEIRSGIPITLVDVRQAADFAAWRIDPGAGRVLNLDPGEVTAHAAELEGPVRVVCARGNTSARAAAALAEAGVEARSVAGGMAAWSRLLVAAAVEIGTPTTVVQFRREARGCLSYLVARDGRALVVDPAPDATDYANEAARRGARIEAVLDTHVHADHVSGARALTRSSGARLLLSAAAVARGVTYAGVVDPVEDGSRIDLGGARVEIVALPGHTTDNVGVLIDGRALIAGDSLFADSVARPDLEAGDAGAADAAATLYRTLHERVLTLPEDTVLLPCHYPGGRLDRAVVTTIGEAAERVAALHLGVDGFVRATVTDMPPRPANHLAIIAANLGRDDVDAASLEVGANNCAV